MTQHSVLAPSSASRRIACPGSRALEAQYPQRESESAKEGTLAHELASRYLVNSLGPFPEAITITGTYTQEMIDGAQIYLNALNPLMNCRFNHGVEETIDISNIASGCFGTVDFYLFDYDTETLHVADYKFGHRYVEVFENWQLIEYAAGLLQKFKATQVVFYIIQPRSYGHQPVRTWGVDLATLETYFDRLREAERLAMSPDAPFQPSGECMYCSGRHVCPALAIASEEAVIVATEPKLKELTSVELGAELQKLKKHQTLLDARITGLEEEALFQLRKGQSVPPFRVDFVQGRERWKLDPLALEAAGRIFNVELMKKMPITPNQAIKAGCPENWVKQMVESVSGAAKLVMDDGKAARKAFGGKK
jgi:hypothetical protein